MASSMSLSLSFYSYADHRDLHSFPTRRSSDLAPISIARQLISGDLPGDPASTRPGENSRDELRSEEHTSELQSRRDLVCRLLLEKKKKINGRRSTKLTSSTCSSAST